MENCQRWHSKREYARTCEKMADLVPRFDTSFHHGCERIFTMLSRPVSPFFSPFSGSFVILSGFAYNATCSTPFFFTLLVSRFSRSHAFATSLHEWPWIREFDREYFLLYILCDGIRSYKMHCFGTVCSSCKQIPLWRMCLRWSWKKMSLLTWFYYRDYRDRRDCVCLTSEEGRISTITLLGTENVLEF